MHTTESRVAALNKRRNRKIGFTSRQVNLILEALFVTLIVTGLLSWIVALDNARILTIVHGIAGLMVLVVLPFKIRGPVRTGMRSGRRSRIVSVLFGLLVLGAMLMGISHTTGVWWGVGFWTALWLHLLLGFVSIPLFLFHVVTRPVRPDRTDLNRRSLLTSTMALGAGATLWGSQQIAQKALGLDSAERAGTGSHELASFDPDNMPRMQWINDSSRQVDFDNYELTIEGTPMPIANLMAMSTPLVAWLDCTDGWRSQQNWDVVPLGELLSDNPSRSVRVASATGYARLFSRADIDNVYLCVGYDGRPLHRGHGAPVRIVAPNRRGPWWIKWVTTVELTDRPAWLQLPLPAT